MDYFNSIKHAIDEAETIPEYIEVYYRTLVCTLLIVPILFLCGFLCGAMLFVNPVKAGKELLNSMF